jgi:tetratricopeptide (TPR) repeat protein
MYLNTPKRYSERRRKRFLISWKFLWLYLLAPIVVIIASGVWAYRDTISAQVGNYVSNMQIGVPQPTATPIIPADDLRVQINDFRRTGQIDDALIALGSLGDAEPNELSVFVTQAWMTLLRGTNDERRFAAAIAASEKAINANPEAPDGWFMMAMALDRAQRFQEALPYALRAQEIDPQHPMGLAVLAEITYDLGDAERAEVLVDQAIEAAQAAQPVNTLALSYAYYVQGFIYSDFAESAIEQFEASWQVAQADPMLPLGFIAQEMWAYYVITRQDAGTMIDRLTLAADRDKDDPRNYYWIGRAHLSLSELEQAKTNLERCRAIDPDELRCLRWLGTIFYRQENYVKAIEVAERAIELGSTDAGAYIVAARSHLDFNRNCSAAVPLAYRGLELTEDTALIDQLGRILNDCGASLAPTATPGS